MNSHPDGAPGHGPEGGGARHPKVRIASLGSGSGGNGTLLSWGEATFLIDCGFGLKEASARLARCGVGAGDLAAILVTHEHSDHASGVRALAQRFGTPVLASHGTLRAMPRLHSDLARPFNSGETIAHGDVSIHTVTVPHDAREPTQFVFRQGGVQVGVLTDLGCATPHVVKCFQGCTALFLESNHDRGMLLRGDYPPRLKRRIASDQGHLSNEQAADLLARTMHDGLKQVIVGHVSQQNNSPERVAAAFAPFRPQLQTLRFATQEGGLEWTEVG